MLDRNNGCQTFAGVIAGEVRVGVLKQTVLTGVVVDDARQRGTQTGQVRTTVYRVDRVRERID